VPGEYKDAVYFQINLKGFGSELWNMQGHIRFKADVIRRNARTRLRDNILASFKQLYSPPREFEEKAFAEKLDKNLTFVAEDSVLSGETHFWRIESEINLPPRRCQKGWSRWSLCAEGGCLRSGNVGDAKQQQVCCVRADAVQDANEHHQLSTQLPASHDKASLFRRSVP
jgi:hypothetical protein